MKDIVGYILDEMILESRQNDQNFVGREKKGQATFRRLFFRAASRGSGKQERKDFPSGRAKHVRLGRIGVKGFPDFRRSLGS